MLLVASRKEVYFGADLASECMKSRKFGSWTAYSLAARDIASKASIMDGYSLLATDMAVRASTMDGLSLSSRVF